MKQEIVIYQSKVGVLLLETVFSSFFFSFFFSFIFFFLFFFCFFLVFFSSSLLVFHQKYCNLFYRYTIPSDRRLHTLCTTLRHFWYSFIRQEPVSFILWDYSNHTIYSKQYRIKKLLLSLFRISIISLFSL